MRVESARPVTNKATSSRGRPRRYQSQCESEKGAAGAEEQRVSVAQHANDRTVDEAAHGESAPKDRHGGSSLQRRRTVHLGHEGRQPQAQAPRNALVDESHGHDEQERRLLQQGQQAYPQRSRFAFTRRAARSLRPVRERPIPQARAHEQQGHETRCSTPRPGPGDDEADQQRANEGTDAVEAVEQRQHRTPALRMERADVGVQGYVERAEAGAHDEAAEEEHRSPRSSAESCQSEQHRRRAGCRDPCSSRPVGQRTADEGSDDAANSKQRGHQPGRNQADAQRCRRFGDNEPEEGAADAQGSEEAKDSRRQAEGTFHATSRVRWLAGTPPT